MTPDASAPPASVGSSVEDVDTPALLLDRDASIGAGLPSTTISDDGIVVIRFRAARLPQTITDLLRWHRGHL